MQSLPWDWGAWQQQAQLPQAQNRLGADLVILGTSSAGPVLEPVWCPRGAVRLRLGEGELAEAAEDALAMGLEGCWAVRLNADGESLDASLRLQRLRQAYERLGAHRPSLVVPVGVWLDDPQVDPLPDLLAFCLSVRPLPALGIVAAAPRSAAETPEALVERLYRWERWRQLSPEQGQFLAGIVSTPHTQSVVEGQWQTRWAHAAALLGGLLAALPPGASATHRRLPGRFAEVDWVPNLFGSLQAEFVLGSEPVPLPRRPYGEVVIDGYVEGTDFTVDRERGWLARTDISRIPWDQPVTVRFAYSDLDTLASMGYVVIDQVGQELRVQTAVTAKRYHTGHLSTLRLLQILARRLADVADPFVGDPYSPTAREALQERLQEALQAFVEGGRLAQFELSVQESPPQGVEIGLVLDMWGELDRIQIALQLP